MTRSTTLHRGQQRQRRRHGNLLSTTIFGHKSTVELFQFIYILIDARTQASEPKVSLSIFLSKPITGNGTNTSLIQQRVRIERIRRATGLLCCFDRPRGEVQPGEEVQRAWGRRAGHTRERIEPGSHRHRTRRQSLVDRVRLLLPERVALVPGLGWPHHAVDADLATYGHAKVDADHLVEQRDRLIWDVGDFKVAPPSSAFAGDALGDGVEGDERGVRVEHAHDLLERGERVRVTGVDVGLVHLVRHKDDVVLLAQLDEALLLVEGENRTNGVAGVNND